MMLLGFMLVVVAILWAALTADRMWDDYDDE